MTTAGQSAPSSALALPRRLEQLPIRVGAAAAIFALLVLLIQDSTIIGIVPDLPSIALQGIPAVGPYLALLFDLSPWGFWVTLAVFIVLAQVLVTASSRDPKASEYLYLSYGALLLGGYAWSNLDWTRMLLELRSPTTGIPLASGGMPPIETVLLGTAPLVVGVLFWVVLQPSFARAHYRKKGIPEEEVSASVRGAALGPGAVVGALVGTVIVAIAFQFAMTQGGIADERLSLSTILFPVAAGGALLAIVLLAARRPKPAAPSKVKVDWR